MKLALLGDIALFGICSKSNNPQINDYFKDVSDFLAEMDFVVGNLETPFSYRKKTYRAKSAYIYSDPENVSLLKYLHVNAVSLANNHIFDYGKEGFEVTKKILCENGIAFFGAEARSFLTEVQGNKLAFTGYCCYSTNPLYCVLNGDYGVNAFDIGTVKSISREYANQGYLNILAIHAGIEHVNYPSLDTVKAARTLTEEYPCIYYGHHPHVAQGIERNGDSLISYSLGNFCFDDVYSSASKKPLVVLSENNRSSFILIVEIENSQITSYHSVPIYIGKEKIHLGMGVTNEDLTKYSSVINTMEPLSYTEFRNAKISEYITSRKSRRNLRWYLSRLRLRYLQIILNSKKNVRLYNRCVKSYLP